MTGRRQRKTGRKTLQSFARCPHWIFESESYAALSPRAVKLLLDLNVQYRGSNNGRLVVCDKAMIPRGWKSKDQLYKARHELLDGGWVIVTRQGGKNIPTWYALTFWNIDDSPLYDAAVRSNTVATHAWKKTMQALDTSKPKPKQSARKVKFLVRHTDQPSPQHGPTNRHGHVQLVRSTDHRGPISPLSLVRHTDAY